MFNILLLEPGYRNKYPPLGLMKIAAYHNARGDHVIFAKGVRSQQTSEIFNKRWDRIYITTLFSFEFKKIAETIDFAIDCVGGQRRRVFVGGIAASLMYDEFLKESRWFGVRFISGLLDKSPAESLQLDIDEGDFHAEDLDGTPIEEYIPDYSILKQIESEYDYPVKDAYFGYASRGCVRKCHFCGVPKLEGGQRDGMSISELIRRISKKYDEKRDLLLMDNNITASARYKDIIAEIRDSGFEKGAKLQRNNRLLRRRVDFNQGVDARILCKDKMYLQEMSTICLSPLRIAFDHLGLKKPYIQAVRYANEFGINNLSNYMLYNFYDTPADLFQRLRINIDLNEELGVRIWSFPMRYQPVTLKDRSHVGKNWIWYWLRSFQIILQATRGVVSGNPAFFKHAFGDTREEFETLLSMPHHMIRHRSYYDFGEGKAKKEQYRSLVDSMTESQRHDLLECLAQITSSGLHQLGGMISTQPDNKVKKILTFHRPLGEEEEEYIRDKTRSAKLSSFGNAIDPALSEDEYIEDAGLYENDPAEKEEVFPKQKQSGFRHVG